MIIQSLLDTDLYKFTMMQVVLHRFPAAQVEYRFRCRNPGIDLLPCIDEISREISALCQLRFQERELDYLRSLRFITSDFVDFLGLFQLNEKYVTVAPAASADGAIELIVRGPWLHTILFEVPLLAIVSEVYFRLTQPRPNFDEGWQRLHDKIALLQAQTDADCRIADYGTRRRFSAVWHEQLIQQLQRDLGEYLAGTSNVYHAMKYGLTPLGTMAHEYLQACQALGPRLRDAQRYAFETWALEYRGDLGIALSDTYGFEAFLRDFDLYFCKLFDGARHDSGDPVTWGERLLEHYRRHRVDPATKTLVFSNGLDMPRIAQLYRQFRNRCRLAFGIGTNLTNDLGYTALNIVIKMTRCNGQPVCKLSDESGKTMCDDEAYLAYLREVYGLPAPG
jgi:nicotinate phosphoribosyltransferase